MSRITRVIDNAGKYYATDSGAATEELCRIMTAIAIKKTDKLRETIINLSPNVDSDNYFVKVVSIEHG